MQIRSSGRWERFKSLRQSESMGYIRIGIDEWLRVDGVVYAEGKKQVHMEVGRRGSIRGRGINIVLPTYGAGVLRETGRKTPVQQFGSTVVGGLIEPYRGTRSQERKRLIKQQNRPGKIEFRMGQRRDGRRGVYKSRLRQQEHQLLYEGVERERRRISRERIEPELTVERWALRERGYRESGKRDFRKAVRARNWVEYNAIRVVEKTRVEEVEWWIMTQRGDQQVVRGSSEDKLCGRVDHRNRSRGLGEGLVERRATGEYWGSKKEGGFLVGKGGTDKEMVWLQYKRGEWLQGERRPTEGASVKEGFRRSGPVGIQIRQLRVGREGRYGSMGKDGREWLEKFRRVVKGLVKGEKGGLTPTVRQVDESLKRLLWWGGSTREGGGALVGTRGRELASDVGSRGSRRRGYTARCESMYLGRERSMFWEGEETRREEVKKGMGQDVDRAVVGELKALIGDPVKDVREAVNSSRLTAGLQKERVVSKKWRSKLVQERFVRPKGIERVKARIVQLGGEKGVGSKRKGVKK